jgi:phosphate transport system substrate-binding protein
VKKAHIGTIPGITEYVAEFTSERAMGEEGYLADRGLIPLPASEYAEVQATVAKMPNLNLAKKP